MAVRILGSPGHLEPWAVRAGGPQSPSSVAVAVSAALRISAYRRSFLPSFTHSLSKYAFMRCQVGPPLSILSSGTAAWMPSVHSLHSRPVSEQRQGLDQAWWGCRTVPG